MIDIVESIMFEAAGFVGLLGGIAGSFNHVGWSILKLMAASYLDSRVMAG